MIVRWRAVDFDETTSSVESPDWVPQKIFQSHREIFVGCKLEAVGKNS